MGYEFMEERMAFIIGRLDLAARNQKRKKFIPKNSQDFGNFSLGFTRRLNQIVSHLHLDSNRRALRLLALSLPELLAPYKEQIMKKVVACIKANQKEEFHDLLECLCFDIPKVADWVQQVQNALKNALKKSPALWRALLTRYVGSEDYGQLEMDDLSWKYIHNCNRALGRGISRQAMTFDRVICS
mmetsp:Transcript_14417/g.24204  ORF Transcript_14417/g.24204 Transcript_14417/m.24204 type:complete len:185 (+) Transcript_14417:617-1171(+)